MTKSTKAKKSKIVAKKNSKTKAPKALLAKKVMSANQAVASK